MVDVTIRLALLDVPTAVYRLYGADGALLYVGISHAPDKRFTQHSYERPWWPEVARKAIAWCADRRAAELAEVAAIAEERPRYNVMPGMTNPVHYFPEVNIPALVKPEPARAEPAHEHALTPHSHLLVNGRPKPCSGSFWCQSCATWLPGPLCHGKRQPARTAAPA